MQAGSVRSMGEVLEKTNELLESGVDAGRIGDDLFAFVQTLDGQHALRRALTEPAVPADAKSRLLHALAEGKVSAEALDVVDVAVRNRWSQSRDLADALEHASVSAHVAKADSDGNLDALEDNLFRFARIVEANVGLRELLSDREKSLDGKRKLLRTLLDGKVDESTSHLLGQAVAARQRSLAGVLATYQKVAAERRQSVVATVWVAAPMTEDHKERLATALAQEYSHEVHLNVIVDPEVLGGVRVAVGDEVIDSTVETRLKQARRRLDR